MLDTKIKHFCFAVVALLASYPQLVYSQWVSDSTTNVAVCRATGNQQLPQICSDGDDGAYIVWQDYRSSSRYDVYAQLINKNGVRQWAENGILISNGTNKAINPIICPDGSGGAYIVWEDYRTANNGADLYSQHVTSSGTKTHASGGSKVSAKKGDQLKAKICHNGNGNAFVVYEDNSPYIAQTSRPDLGMNFLTSSGTSWSDTGSRKIVTGLRQNEPCIIDDGAGGCFVAWETSAGGPPNGIFGTRISSTGTVQWGWTAQGVLIHRGADFNMNSRYPKVSRDGNEFVLAWEEAQYSFETHGYDILCQRVRSDSSLKWFSSATVTSTSVGDQIEPVPFTDNNGGALVAYTNYFGTKEIAATRVMSNGATLRPNPPIYPVCNMANDQYGAVGLKTPNGMFLVWNDERMAATQSAIYANRIDTTPARQLFPAGSSSASRWGIPISKAANVNKDQVVMAGRENGAIVAWRDTRNSSTGQDIYCQLVFFNGTLPVELSSFDIKALSQGVVRLDWKTAMEKDNAGFEIERRNISDPHTTNTFDVVASHSQFGSLKGLANSNHERNYSFIDVPNAAGIYEYRLVDVSLDGERTLHQIKSVEVGSLSETGAWSVEQNFPNPFSDGTNIYFEMPQAAIVELQVFDALGRNYTMPTADQLLQKGPHTITIRSSDLEGPSGTYYYMLTARNAETGEIIWKMPKAGMMVKITN
ncbi:MAG TPA: T9SS type A sorting domain-containing protein [Candidatus Kapabacteria bacterium]